MRFYAFLRAINVGRHNRVKMEALRAACIRLGFRDVATYLQSGNLACEADGDEEAVAVRLEAALAAMGLRGAAAMVRSRDELRAVSSAAAVPGFDPAQHT